MENAYDGLVFLDEQGVVCGSIFWQTRENVIHVFAAWVREDLRNQGYGYDMLTALVEKLQPGQDLGGIAHIVYSKGGNEYVKKQLKRLRSEQDNYGVVVSLRDYTIRVG